VYYDEGAMRILGLLLCLLPAWGAEIGPIYTHLPGGGYRLPLPESVVNWKALALQIVGKNVEKPEASRVIDYFQNKDSMGNTEVSFPAPVPQALKERTYYAISQWGLTKLRVRNMMGAVRYGFDPNGTKPVILRIAFTGQALFDPVPDDEVVEGAFVLTSNAAVTSDAVEIPEGAITIARESDGTRVTYTAEGVTRGLRITSPASARTEAAALVTIGGERYVFLQWAPMTCEYMFSLLKLTAAGMEEAASNAYGCEL
jgi:hypothetical protein